MIAVTLNRGRWVALSVAMGILLPGCGGSGESSTGEAAATNAASLPTASISSGDAPGAFENDEGEEADDPSVVREDPEEGTPEWMVREAMKLRLEAPPKTQDVEELKAHRKERNEKIIKLCQDAISATHSNAEKERVFNFAVQNLLEARLQLAMAGDKDSIDALYEDAAALHKRNATSAAAAEGSHALVNLAYSRAKLAGSDYQQWLDEFARQATHFAKSFPGEVHRSLPLLFTAARSCELAGQTKQAIAAYEVLKENFASSPYGPRSAAVLRRLKLPGNPPQLSGPTLDGEHLVVDDLLGNVVLIVFWSSEAKPFVDRLPELLETTRDLSKQNLQVVGVNLDNDATTASQFIIRHKVPWPQIFYSSPSQQGWNNPIVVYYGLMEIPAYWLIDQSGNVVSTSLTLETLRPEATRLLGASKAEANADETASPRPDSKPHVLAEPGRKPGKAQPREEDE